MLLPGQFYQNAALSPSGAPPSTLKNNLVSFWELEEASGDRADSVVATGNTLGAAGGGAGQGTGVVAGSHCLSLVSLNTQYVSISNADSSGTLQIGGTDCSFCAWINATSFNVDRGIILKGSSDPREYILKEITGPSVSWNVVASGGTIGTVASTFGNLSTDTWYFIVAMYDDSTNELTLSINNQGTPATATGVASYSSTGRFYIGIFNEGFDGLIDQVGFWNRLLTSDEITQLYNSGLGLRYADM